MFDPRKQTSNVHNHTTLNDSWEPQNFDFQVSQKHRNIQFRGQKMEDQEDDDESGASSPTLWRNSPPRSPVHPINYRSLSPNSRTQAIARGQWELMEMVKNMPESSFELSLKDLVEQPKSFESEKECLINNRERKQAVQNRVNIKKNDQIRKAKMMMRSKSVGNGGVFIKIFPPVSLRSKRKNSSANTTRVSPKPEECENSSSKSLEKEWWKKRFSASSSSNSTGSTGSRGSSSNSRNNSNRKREGLLSSCWSSFCFSEKNKVMTDAFDW